MPILGITASGITGSTISTTSYQSIATVTVGSGGSANITFSSIPSTYTHLQIRGSSKSTRVGAGQENIYFSLNGDTGGNNYSNHGLQGNGSSTSGFAGVNAPGNGVIFSYTANSETDILGAQIIDILDYANTNKYKTLRGLSGFDSNGAGFILFSSALWRNTNAITSINLLPSSGVFAQYTQFALYGIKGV